MQSWNPETHYHHDCKKNCHIICEIGISHCCECSTEYLPDLEHCCECGEWDNQQTIHCDKSHFLFSIEEEHCCDCKTSWNFSKKHCCKCGEYSSTNTKHCNECHTLYPILNVHCCKCKQSWDSSITQQHCCLCQQLICKCSELKKQIFTLARKINISSIYQVDESESDSDILVYKKIKWFDSVCIDENCFAFSKFLEGIRQIKDPNLSLLEFLQNESNFITLWHGTPRIENALQICCQSWQLTRRGTNGQAHGQGEYFSSKPFGAPKSYTGNQGVIICTLTIKPEICNTIHTVPQKNDETWYVINNTDTASFALPIGILDYRNVVSTYDKTCCCTKKTQDIFNMTQNRKVRFSFAEGESFIPFNETSQTSLLDAIKKKMHVVKINPNEYTYEINFGNMTQINLRSKRIRQIKVELLS